MQLKSIIITRKKNKKYNLSSLVFWKSFDKDMIIDINKNIPATGKAQDKKRAEI
tara:strand:- start:82 stop:243 length:162 start_codon:yes stop_codon:yes gene_type:complete